ncbi:hypothetical protein A943_10855 [Bacillus sp. CPSM8]|uniref:Uncharacterized protein n=1 Tax=Bacillus paralicheniformis TaxID=1648923 RepID=A0ABY3G0R3_9BACI|nr:hypothetical protein A943_10855 [Bacillus sp. CPSM8]TWJ41347.1 hypothetical protein CHCC5027_1325 [Bacillus paralicheniformis]TWL42706.1 hypothetical protein CHCC15381_1882 [Bacillus paralicheniformis]
MQNLCKKVSKRTVFYPVLIKYKTLINVDISTFMSVSKNLIGS